MDQAVLDWFLTERGIKEDTLEDFLVRQEGDFLVFPYPNGEKLRRNPTLDGKRQFMFTKGKTPELYQAVDTGPQKFAFLVEGETDTMRLYQELGDKASIYGLSGIEAWQPHFAGAFTNTEKVYVLLDNDLDYSVQGRVDTAWRQIRKDVGPKAHRVFLPMGIKDVCEFFTVHDMDTFKELVERKTPNTAKLKRLNLMQTPPPTDWLVEGLICAGDVTLIIGESNLGKSWLTMDLAVKVARGSGKWLGHDVKKQGNVMYIDEENPEDIIPSRLQRLGLTHELAKRIHYLYRPGIWMNKDPDTLLHEAYDIEPDLIVLDSLSRIHSEDENNANAMASLFREAIQPLARDTGAAVVVIHHVIKSEDASSIRRARGSGDITAVVDSALDCRPGAASGKLAVSQYKSRRRLGGETIYASIDDVADGRVELRVTPQEVFAF